MENKNNKESQVSNKDNRKLLKLRETINSNPEVMDGLLRSSFAQSLNAAISSIQSSFGEIWSTKFADEYQASFEKLFKNLEVSRLVSDSIVALPKTNIKLPEFQLPPNLSKVVNEIVANSIKDISAVELPKPLMSEIIKGIGDQLRDIDFNPTLPVIFNPTLPVTKATDFIVKEKANSVFITNDNLVEMLMNPEENADFYITVEPKDESISDSQTNSYTITDKNGNVLSREESVNFLKFVLANLLQE